LAAVLALAGGSVSAWATPFERVDATTTCISGLNQQYCILTGAITGANGTLLVSALTDLTALTPATAEPPDAFLDRSGELDLTGVNDTDPIVSGPQMMSSVQLSFDPRLDLSPRRPGRLSGREVFRAGRAFAGLRGPELSQIELTLGASMRASGGEKSIAERSLPKSGYVSFALVNQAHVAAKVDVEERPEEYEGILQ